MDPNPRVRRTRGIAVIAEAAAIAALAAGIGVLGVAVTRGSEGGVARHVDQPTLVVAPLAPRAPEPEPEPEPEPVPATTPPLPTPQDVPRSPYADVPVTPIGRIEIPKIGLDDNVYEGVWLTVIDRGPGHWPGSAAPGQWGNTVIAGHRATHSSPFRHIDELAPGDEIVVTSPDGRFTYQVSGSEVVSPEAFEIVTQHPGRTITIFACNPVGSATSRYVVYGTLANAQ
jgi:LPXTG-site transpeptidase (sortase) family protein